MKALLNLLRTAPQPRSRQTPALVLATAIAATGFAMPTVPHAGGTSLATHLSYAHISFGLKAIKSLSQEEPNENIFVSPLSIALALSMALNGANGETKRAMQKTLEVQNLDVATVNQESLGLIGRLKHPDPNVELSVANSVWARKGMHLKREFLSVVRDYYSAEISVLDFNDRNAAGRINAWVNRSTRGKIPSVVQTIPPDMVMYLINAVYFKGGWTTQFDKRLTEGRTFAPAQGAPKKHPLMRRHGELPYFETEDFQTVSLSYGKNNRFAMYVFLPENLKSFVETLDVNKWSNWMKQYGGTEGTILLPRFKMQYQKELRGLLAQLGMGIAFSSHADFSGFGDGDFLISEVRHKTYVDVNEEGTEAAAATSVGVGITSVRPRKKPFYMEVNRPFFFAISDNETNEILLMGIVQNP